MKAYFIRCSSGRAAAASNSASQSARIGVGSDSDMAELYLNADPRALIASRNSEKQLPCIDAHRLIDSVDVYLHRVIAGGSGISPCRRPAGRHRRIVVAVV